MKKVRKSKLKGGDDSSTENNPWDDSLLIKAYDRAVGLAKKNMEKMNQSKASKPVLEQTKERQEDKKNEQTLPDAQDAVTNNKGVKWKRGMYCRCEYSVDGVEYEAEVVSVQRNKAVIRYLGYNNEENVPLSKLTLSHGPAFQKLQIEQSIIEQAAAEDAEESYSANAAMPSAQTEGMVPPPPPPTLLGRLSQNEEEALSAMLMSWYMSGYHTGYYQGLKNGNTHQKKK